jgi:phage tail sheath protein FI
VPRDPIFRAETSTALFIGRAPAGPVDAPVACAGFDAFTDTFGAGGADSDLALAVRLFFLNGGVLARVLRLDDVMADAQAYAAAYDRVDPQLDSFNLMVLPRDHNLAPEIVSTLWAPAAAFCVTRRALLLIDSPDGWTDPAAVLAGLDALRAGLARDHAAVFLPRLAVDDNGTRRVMGPGGAIAGIIARIDAAHGVWKAPAGLEAGLHGITDLEAPLTSAQDDEVYHRGVNVIRRFPQGIVNWGARTLDGDDNFGSDYKYIPVRRLALHIEQSLVSGLAWVAFEPDGEPLWAQIRMAVGVFMQGLFREGAFQGATARDAWFLKCDAETTTQADIDNGIVNIVVGFAPLKPAEFVVLSLRQVTAGGTGI